MGRAIPAKEETQCDEEGESQKQQSIPSKLKPRSPPIEVSVDCSEKRGCPNYDQESSEEHTSDAEAHMQFNVANRNQCYLSDQQQNPAGKDGSVHVNQRAWKMGVKDSRQVVATRESRENRGEDKSAHSSKEIVVRGVANVTDLNAMGRAG
jgi:hypothetical protein